MSSTKNSIPPRPHNAYTAEFLLTSGPGSFELLEAAGQYLLSQARETISVHSWPSPLDEARKTLEAAAVELRQMSRWLENSHYVEMLLQNGERQAAYLFHVADVAGPGLSAIAESFALALETPEDEICPPVHADGEDKPALNDNQRRLLLWEASQDLMTASRRVRINAEIQDDPGGTLFQLLDLERTFHEHILPTLHHLTLEEEAPREAALADAASILQRHLATLAECLRLWVPSIRRLADVLGKSLPALEDLAEQTEPLSLPASVFLGIDGLLAESLCGAIADLEAIARQDEEKPEIRPRPALELWEELDPRRLTSDSDEGAES